MGQSLSSGFVGALCEEHPDINPIFVNPYARLSAPSELCWILRFLVNGILRTLYRLNTLDALKVLRGRACIITANQDSFFGSSHLSQMLKTARNAHQKIHSIMVNGEHAEMQNWVGDSESLSQLENYFVQTVDKAESCDKLTDIMSLQNYHERYRRSLSLAEKYHLTQRLRDLILNSSYTPQDMWKDHHIRNWPRLNTAYTDSAASSLYEFSRNFPDLGKKIIKEIIQRKYEAAAASNDQVLAQAWIDKATERRFTLLAKRLRQDWERRQAR